MTILRPEVERLRDHLVEQREDASWTIYGEELADPGLDWERGFEVSR